LSVFLDQDPAAQERVDGLAERLAAGGFHDEAAGVLHGVEPPRLDVKGDEVERRPLVERPPLDRPGEVAGLENVRVLAVGDDEEVAPRETGGVEGALSH